MAELKQSTIAGEKVTQQQSSHKRADFSKERVGAVAGTAGAVTQGIAKGTQKAVSDSFAGEDLSEIEIGANVDLLEEDRANLLTDAQVSSGGTITARQLSEQTDVALNRATLTQRGLQEALDRGLITEKQAKVRANIALKHSSNTLVGSLIVEPLRNIYAPTTGNPSGSPAVTFTKGAAEQEADVKQKARLQEVGKREASIQSLVLGGKTRGQAVETMAYQAKQKAELAALEFTIKKGEASDKMMLTASNLRLSNATERLDEDMMKAYQTGEKVEAQEVSILLGSVQRQADVIRRNAIEDGMSADGVKELDASLATYVKSRTDYINSQSNGTILAGAVKESENAAKIWTAQNFTEAYAINIALPAVGKDMGDRLFNKKQAQQVIGQYHGFTSDSDINKILKSVEDIIPSMGRVTRADPTMTSDDVVGVHSWMHNPTATPEARDEIMDIEKTNAIVEERFASLYKNSPNQSIKGATGKLQVALNSNAPDTTIRSYVDSVNIGVKSIRDNLSNSPTYGGYKFKFANTGDVLQGRSGGRGLVFPVAGEGQPPFPDDMKDAVKSVAKLMRDTPSMWAGQYESWEEATLAYLNDGASFSPAEVQANHKNTARGQLDFGDPTGISDAVTSVIETLGDLTGSTAGRIRDSEGIEQTAPREPAEQLNLIIKGLSEGNLKATDPMVQKALKDLTGGLLNEATPPTGNRFTNPADVNRQSEGEKFANRTTVTSGATEFLIKDEGYSEKLPANVPKTPKGAKESGMTVGGLDLAHGDKKAIESSLSKVLPAETVKELMANSSKTGDDARDVLKDVEIKLTNEDIRQVQEEYLTLVVDPQLEKALGDQYDTLPDSIKEPLRALSFLNVGPNSLKSLKKAFETGKDEDVEKAINNYESYWSKEAGTPHNKARSQRVADAIREFAEL